MSTDAQQQQHDSTPASSIDAATLPFVTVHFPVLEGRQLPADHGYALYSAITRHLPALHGASWLGLELLSGVPWREGIIVLPTRGAHLRLRIPADRYGHVLPLAGCRLDISGHPLRLGIPTARPLMPAASLYARHVTIKKFTDPEPFLDAARRQLDALGITALLELPTDEQGRPRRRLITIHGKRVVGFSLAAHHLSDDDSFKLQTHGIGGRRAMGCGLFVPITGKGHLYLSEENKIEE
ncbi:MAG: type I-MYXAN CRISPR-associated protein Cas6/Cmx6 [Pyrinomonadaceae bacterium]